VIKYLATYDEKCVGCMTCTSVCSKLYFKEDNPAKSRIQVNEMPGMAIARNKSGAIVIDKKKCIGCLACVAVCPIGAMRWFPGNPLPFKCIACDACAKACPKGALEILTKEGAE